MKSIDDIIAQEKTVDYQQRNKELFSYYTLTLIAQEQAARRLKTRLKLVLWFLLPALVGLLLSPAMSFLTNALNVFDGVNIVRVVLMAVASYAIAGVCVLALRRGRILT
jgi:UDP-N-acetylmuramyl pentapeptide phosphotransferase/UDP-N-acetylglucosamine-1-phosphate transferase